MDLLRVGPYTILRKLGQGGMGVVYEAEHAEIARRVAIKVLSGDGIKSAEAVARLLNEARAVNIIRHRGIVGVSDLGRLPDGSPYIVMELLEGQTLRERLRTGLGRLAALRIARQVGAALAAAHDKGILHRDIRASKPLMDSHAWRARGNA